LRTIAVNVARQRLRLRLGRTGALRTNKDRNQRVGSPECSPTKGDAGNGLFQSPDERSRPSLRYDTLSCIEGCMVLNRGHSFQTVTTLVSVCQVW